MSITLRGRSRGGLARHRTRTWWHDIRDIGMAARDLTVDAIVVVCSVGGERADRTIDLVKQSADLRAVINIIRGQRRRDDLAGVDVNTDVQFAPRPAPVRAMLLDQPLASTGQLEPGAGEW